MSRKILTLLSLLFLSQISYAYETFNKTRLMSIEKWNNVDLESNKGRMYYIECMNTLKHNCSVLLEKSSHSNDSYSCDISDEYKTNLKLQGTLGNDKVVLIWKNVGMRSFKYGVLHLNDCRLFEAKLDGDSIYKPWVFVYDDYFDVVYEKSQLCANQACKVRFDDEGEVVSASVTHYIRGFEAPFATDLSDDAILYRSGADAYGLDFMFTTRDFYLHSFNERKKLATIEGSKVSTSIAYGYFGLCEAHNHLIRCLQFDGHGHPKFETVLEVHEKDTANVLYVENLPHGGIILALEECFNCRTNNKFTSSLSAYKDGRHYLSLGKIDIQGKAVGSRIIGEYGGGHFDLYRDSDGNYCVMNSFAENYSIFYSEKKVNFMYECFNETDLNQHSF